MFKKEKFNHSKIFILADVLDNATSTNIKKLINKFNNILSKINTVEPLRPIILPKNNTVNEAIRGKKIINIYN